MNLNENKEKIENIKANAPKKTGTVSNPLSKQLNSLKKPALKQPVETVKNKKRKLRTLFLRKHQVLSHVLITLIQTKLLTECMPAI